MDSTKNRVKLCYILPKYDAQTDEHFYHVYGFLNRLAEIAQIYLVIERCNGLPSFPGINHIFAQKSVFRPFRFLEIFFMLARIRFSGCRKFYVHYSYYGAIAAGILTRMLGGKVYYWNCGLAGMFHKKWELRRSVILNKFSTEIPLKISLFFAHHLVTGTFRMAEYYSREFRFPRSRILVVPNEIDLSRFKGGNRESLRKAFKFKPSEKVVLFVHHISERKGAHYLPEIFSVLSRRFHLIRFIVAGDGPGLPVLKTRFASEGLSDIVAIIGKVPNREIIRYFKASDLFIMPSKEEGFPRVLLEAMASGLPFTAFAVGGVRDIIPQKYQSLVAEPGDIRSFCANAIRILSDTRLSNSLSREGIRHVRRFSQPEVMKIFKEKILDHG